MSNTINDINNNKSVDSIISDDWTNNFFSLKEFNSFFAHRDGMILYQTNGIPYINYTLAKTVFEKAVGGLYNTEILTDEFDSDRNVYIVRLRVTLFRDGQSIHRDCIGCADANIDKTDGRITNFSDLPKTAITDAFKKFLTDYIGVGSVQLSQAKMDMKNKKNPTSKTKFNNSASNATQGYACSDCGVSIDENVFTFSSSKHKEKRALCISCQKKY